MNARHLTLVLSIVLLLAGSAFESRGQNPQIRQLERVSPPTQPPTNATESVESTEAVESGDLGREVILQPAPRLRMFEVSSDTQLLYDSNPLLLRNQEKADGLLYQTFQVSFTPRLVDKLVSSAYLRYQFIRYFDQSRFDFDSEAAGLYLGYPLRDWLTIYSGWSAQQLVAVEGSKSFYGEFDTQVGLRASFPLGDRASYFFGYQFDWRPSDPSVFNRLDHFAFLGLNVRIVDKLTAQLLYRLRFEDYLEDTKTQHMIPQPPPAPPLSVTIPKPRSDIENLISLALVYPFNEYVNVRLYALYSTNDSSRDQFDYDVVNVGGGLNLSFRF